jgi:hypothetical protein
MPAKKENDMSFEQRKDPRIVESKEMERVQEDEKSESPYNPFGFHQGWRQEHFQSEESRVHSLKPKEMLVSFLLLPIGLKIPENDREKITFAFNHGINHLLAATPLLSGNNTKKTFIPESLEPTVKMALVSEETARTQLLSNVDRDSKTGATTENAEERLRKQRELQDHIKEIHESNQVSKLLDKLFEKQDLDDNTKTEIKYDLLKAIMVKLFAELKEDKENKAIFEELSEKIEDNDYQGVINIVEKLGENPETNKKLVEIIHQTTKRWQAAAQQQNDSMAESA